jgi:hypothetical protein
LKGGAPANVHSQNERNENKMAKTWTKAKIERYSYNLRVTEHRQARFCLLKYTCHPNISPSRSLSMELNKRRLQEQLAISGQQRMCGGLWNWIRMYSIPADWVNWRGPLPPHITITSAFLPSWCVLFSKRNVAQSQSSYIFLMVSWFGRIAIDLLF